MIFLLLVIVVIIALLLRGPRRNVTIMGPTPPQRRPLEILKERYARGEITREQFEEMRRDLES